MCPSHHLFWDLMNNDSGHRFRAACDSPVPGGPQQWIPLVVPCSQGTLFNAWRLARPRQLRTHEAAWILDTSNMGLPSATASHGRSRSVCFPGEGTAPNSSPQKLRPQLGPESLRDFPLWFGLFTFLAMSGRLERCATCREKSHGRCSERFMHTSH